MRIQENISNLQQGFHEDIWLRSEATCKHFTSFFKTFSAVVLAVYSINYKCSLLKVLIKSFSRLLCESRLLKCSGCQPAVHIKPRTPG